MNKQTTYRVKRILTVLFLVTFLVTLTATSVSAQKHNMAGNWVIVQSNKGPDGQHYIDTFSNVQMTSSTDFNGLVDGSHGLKGNCNGRISGDQIIIQINWDGGDIGYYYGTFYFDGRLIGNGYDLSNEFCTWYSMQTF